MLKGKIQMGTAAQTYTRWHNDTLDDCSPEDQVWGWSVQSSEILDMDKEKFNDEVVRKMLYMSLLDN